MFTYHYGDQKLACYYTCGDHQSLMETKFEDISEVQNGVFVSGLQFRLRVSS